MALWIKAKIMMVRRTLTSQECAGATNRRTSNRRSIVHLFLKCVLLSQIQPYIQHVIRTNRQHMPYSHVYCGWYPVDEQWRSLCTQFMFAWDILLVNNRRWWIIIIRNFMINLRGNIVYKTCWRYYVNYFYNTPSQWLSCWCVLDLYPSVCPSNHLSTQK